MIFAQDKKWWHDATIYQIYPRSFQDSNGDGNGDLRGIINRLDYLEKLGVNIVWISPIYASPMKDNGYDISDYYAIDKDFGTMEDFDELVILAKERNIRIMMDLVVSHTSNEHPWFIEASKGKDNAYRNYYIWRDPKKNGDPPCNWQAHFAPSTWKYDEATKQYFFFLFSEFQPDLNWENPTVRQEIYKMMHFWLKKGLAGFRIDTMNLYSKNMNFPDSTSDNKYLRGSEYFRNGPKIHEYIKEMHSEVLSHYDCVNVGETPDVTPQMTLEYVAPERKEVEMLFQFEQVELDNGEELLTQKPIDLIELKENIEKWQTQLYGKGWESLYLGNHDQPRALSRWGDDRPYYREKSATMLATIQHMQQGTPYIYQGEELGLPNTLFNSIDEFNDLWAHHYFAMATEKYNISPARALQNLNLKSRDHSRIPMAWDTSEYFGFSNTKPWIRTNPEYAAYVASTELEKKDSIFYYYQHLIELRKKHKVIQYGNFELVDRDNPALFIFTRKFKQEQLLIIANYYAAPNKFELPIELHDVEVLISNYTDVTLKSTLHLRSYEALVLHKK